MYIITKIVDIEWRKIEKEISYPKANPAPWDQKKFEIKETSTKGKGAYATEKISKGELVVEFEGQRVSISEINQRIANETENIDDPLQVDDEVFLVLNNSAYYMNHSCDPNSAIKGDDKLIAIRDIEKGEEITYDYSATVGTNITSWTMECKCGSVNCRGTLGNVTTVPKEQLEKYLAAGGVQKFIRKQLKESKNITNKSNNFYKISSIVMLAVGSLSFLAGLLSEYGPEIFRDDAMFFPAYFYQLGYGVLAILFYFYSFIAKHIITKIIWWIYFVILVIGFYVLMISDPFSLQKLAGQVLMPKDTATENVSDTIYENGVVRTKSGDYVVKEQPVETAAEPVTPVEF